MRQLNPNTRSIAEGIIIAILLLCALALFLGFIYTIRIIFIYIIIAAIIALMGRPLMILLHRKMKFSSTFSAGFTVILFLILFTGLFYFLVPLLFQQAEILSKMNTADIQELINQQLTALNQALLKYHITVLDDFMRTGLEGSLNFSRITSWFSNILNFLTEISIGTFSVLFISFFFLKERDLLNRMILSPVPDNAVNRVSLVLEQVKDLLSRYFLGITFQVFIMLFLYYILLYFIVNVDADVALIIALLCAMCNVVPYIGPVVGFFIMLILAVSNFYTQGYEFNHLILSKVYWIIGGYLFAQLIDNFINQPLIYSRSVKSHPLEIFLIIIIGGLLAGVQGVILAVPFYTILRVVLKEFFSEFKFVQSITKNI